MIYHIFAGLPVLRWRVVSSIIFEPGADWVSFLLTREAISVASLLPRDTTPTPCTAGDCRSTLTPLDPFLITHATSGGLTWNPSQKVDVPIAMYLQHHDPTDVPLAPSRVLRTRADLIANSDSDTATNKLTANNHTVVRAMDGRPTLSLSFVPAPPAEPVDSQSAVLHTPTTTVHVTVIVCSAVGGAVFVAVILGLIYAIRIRRRARRILGRMDVLGPELAPTSPYELPQISPDEFFQHDWLRIDPPAPSDQMGHVLPLGTPIVTSQTSIEDPDESMSASHIPTIIAPPPTAVRESIRLPNPWSSTRSSPVIIAWPNPASRSRVYPAA